MTAWRWCTLLGEVVSGGVYVPSEQGESIKYRELHFGTECLTWSLWEGESIAFSECCYQEFKLLGLTERRVLPVGRGDMWVLYSVQLAPLRAPFYTNWGLAGSRFVIGGNWWQAPVVVQAGFCWGNSGQDSGAFRGNSSGFWCALFQVRLGSSLLLRGSLLRNGD